LARLAQIPEPHDQFGSLPALSLAHPPAEETQSVALRLPLFMWVYLIYPIVGLLIVSDFLFFDQTLRWELPNSADQVLLFLVFFNIPHGLSGFFSLFDKEYIRSYRTQLMFSPLIFIPVFLIRDAQQIYYANTFYALWTIYHGLSQATGICRMTMGKVSGAYFLGWRWSLVVLHALLLPFIPGSVFSWGFFSISGIALGLALAVNLFCTWQLHLREKSRSCQTLFGLTSLSTALLPLLFFFNYSFFYPVCSRFVHDISAIAFNSTHDHNRAASKPGANGFWALFAKAPIPIYVLNPLFAVLFGLFAFLLMRYDLGLRFLFGLSLFHYFMETWTWRRGAPHRNHVRLA
jgi:hypothetical protein